MAKYFADELENVSFQMGLKNFKCPPLPADLANDPRWAVHIENLVKPYKKLRALVSIKQKKFQRSKIKAQNKARALIGRS